MNAELSTKIVTGEEEGFVRSVNFPHDGDDVLTILNVQFPHGNGVFQVIYDGVAYTLARPEWSVPGSWVDVEVIKAKEFTVVAPFGSQPNSVFQLWIGKQLIHVRCPQNKKAGDPVTFTTRTFRFVQPAVGNDHKSEVHGREELVEIEMTINPPKWTKDRMWVIDIEGTLRTFKGKGLPKRLRLDAVVLKQVNVLDPQVKRDLALASWRWDLQEDERMGRVSKGNISKLIQEAKSRGKKFCAVDCFSVNQNQGPDAVMEELLAFSSLYEDRDVSIVTSYGIDSVWDFMNLSRVVERGWITSEWLILGPRVTVGELMRFPKTSGGVFNPLLFNSHLDFIFSEMELKDDLLSNVRFLYHSLVTIIAFLLSLLYILGLGIVLAIPIVYLRVRAV